MRTGEPYGSGGSLLISRRELATRIDELAADISSRYASQERPLVCISVLKGATFFLADLIRALSIDVAVDFMSISSYAASGPDSGVVRIIKDVDEDIAGRDVLLVENIVDTGLTLTYLRRTLLARQPRSVATVTLLDKSARRIVPVPIEYAGFEIPDVFVIGYGLDHQALYRNVPDIFEVPDIAALRKDPALLVTSLFGSQRD